MLKTNSGRMVTIRYGKPLFVRKLFQLLVVCEKVFRHETTLKIKRRAEDPPLDSSLHEYLKPNRLHNFDVSTRT